MKILALLASLLIFQSAGAEEYKLGCKLTLQPNEFTRTEKGIFIKAETMQEIIKSPDAWMLEYHVFIYVECEYCGSVHLAEHPCQNPNCRGKMASFD